MCVIGVYFYYFGGEYGVMGVVLLVELYIMIYMWFEYCFVVVDVFMCGVVCVVDVVDVIVVVFGMYV